VRLSLRALAVTFALLPFTGTPDRSLAEPTGAEVEVEYVVELLPDEDIARVSIALGGPSLPESLRLRIDPTRHLAFDGDGTTSMVRGRLVWEIPPGGGSLRYEVRIDHDRAGPGQDAAITERWALFRGEDLFPPMGIETPEDVETRATLRFELPEQWSIVTPWSPHPESGVFEIEQEHRYFDRPTGWILAGRLGITRETIEGVRLAIANPAGHDLHRLDILALLRWTLDDLVEVFGKAPKRFLIVGAADPMWRGGLSGPGSLYVHAERPLIQRDGTSPILHEMVHCFMHARAGTDGDWVVEGLAEYYSLALLRRSRTISRSRYERSLAKLKEKGAKAGELGVSRASAAVAARGAVILAALDEAIRKRTDGRKSLDDVVRRLRDDRKPITSDGFRKVAHEVSGLDLDPFFAEHGVP
jgi:predicted metalloprotease with PDZ domain